MQRLIIVSDIHYDSTRLRALLPIINSSDYMIFCGDGWNTLMSIRGEITTPLACVRGNCDLGADISDSADIVLGNTKAFVTHGHMQNVKYAYSSLVSAARLKGCSLAFFGHTHSFTDRTESGIRLINPGALCEGSYVVATLDGAELTCRQEHI